MKVVVALFGLMACAISSPVNMHSWSSSNSKSMNTMNSGPLTVTTVDGETHYEIEGKTIDLEKADVLEDNDEESVFAPTEVEGAKVTVFKKKHQVVLDYKGHRMVTSNNRNRSFNFVAYN
uniref:Uncharacterized protein n=2 Tax=Lygus hesperus TaxID=30085 RepID=A0A146KT11_LYGHE